MTLLVKILLTVFLTLLAYPLWALVSFQTTLSAGQYQDIQGNAHSTIFMNWRFNHMTDGGTETNAELGINNNLVQDKWGVYPYLLNINIPLTDGFEEAPYRKSRLIVGRQLFTEGFELDSYDGLLLNHYWTSTLGSSLFSGSTNKQEDQDANFDEQIHGLSLFYNSETTHAKLGHLSKMVPEVTKQYGHLSFMREFASIPLRPSITARTQYNISDGAHDQSAEELMLNLGPVAVKMGHSSRRPDKYLHRERLFIYELFSISNQESLTADISIPIGERVYLNFRGEQISYHSPAKKEEGNLEEVSLDYHDTKTSINPFILRLSSYGGTMMNYGVYSKRALSQKHTLKFDVDATQVDKINGIKTWLFHSRLGLDSRFWNRWRSLLAMEYERNHIYAFDIRAVFYVTHFYY